MSPLVLARPRPGPRPLTPQGHLRPPRRSRPRRRLLLALLTLLAVLATGCNVRSFGANVSGQLGDGTTTARSTPVRATGITSFSRVSTGDDHTCGISATGSLHCWGEGDRGQLGLGTTTDATEPTQVGAESDWVAVSAGSEHTCGIRTAKRRIFCWGLNDDGRAAPGAPAGIHLRPFDTGLGEDYTALSAGDRHTCGVQSATRLYCWGYNADGRLGAGDDAPIPFARRVTGIQWRSVSAGVHTCGLESSGTLKCWGPNSDGQLGVGDRASSNGPRTVLGALTWTDVDLGRAHTCARADDGKVHCWGDNSRGQLGTGTADRVVPTVVAPDSRWTDVTAGGDHTCAIRVPAQAHCWGRNTDGQLGDGTTTGRATPAPITGGADVEAVAVSAGARHTHVVVAAE